MSIVYGADQLPAKRHQVLGLSFRLSGKGLLHQINSTSGFGRISLPVEARLFGAHPLKNIGGLWKDDEVNVQGHAVQ